MVSITVSEVEDVYGVQDPNVPNKQALVSIAERFTEQVRSGRMAQIDEIEGDEEDFAKYVAAFLWDRTTGRDLNQEFQTGNNEPGDFASIDSTDALGANRYGQIALMIAGGNRGSVSIVRADF